MVEGVHIHFYDWCLKCCFFNQSRFSISDFRLWIHTTLRAIYLLFKFQCWSFKCAVSNFYNLRVNMLNVMIVVCFTKTFRLGCALRLIVVGFGVSREACCNFIPHLSVQYIYIYLLVFWCIDPIIYYCYIFVIIWVNIMLNYLESLRVNIVGDCVIEIMWNP